MTLKGKDDSDKMQYRLTPSEQYIFEWAKQRPDQPFSFLDFTDKYTHGTIRNAFLRLKNLRLIRLYCRSFSAFYVLSSSKIKHFSKPMTVTHTGGRHGVKRIKFDLDSLLDSLDWEDVCRVHNVVFRFYVDGLYDYCLKKGTYPFNEKSKAITLPTVGWSKGRILKPFLQCNGTVLAYLKCSNCPVEVSIEGLVSLASFLGGIRTRLVELNISSNPQSEPFIVPQVENWVVTQWHYGRDGIREFSGPALNVTFKTWCNKLARIYLKNNNKLLKGRLEIIEVPRKPLPQVFEDKINLEFKGDLKICQS
jgi:hypothetical protein